MLFDLDWHGASAPDDAPARVPVPRASADPVATGLPPDVESRLAELVGIDALPRTARPDVDEGAPVGVVDGNPAARLLRVAELVTLGCSALLIAWAVISAKLGETSPHFHQLPFAAWGVGAAICGLTSAKLAGDAHGIETTGRRRLLGVALVAAMLVCVTGVVVNTDGAAGPAWVLFLPVVLVAGAVRGPVVGLLVGAGAAAGLYAGAGFADSLGGEQIARLVVLLPAFPAIGWSAGALAGLAREAASEAERQREALERDVAALSGVLAQVANGDLTVMPATSPNADPTTTAVAVAFADTLVALRRLVYQMDSVAQQLSGSAEELAGRAEEEAGAISSQVAAVAQTTQTVEQLAATAAAIAETAVRVTELAGATRDDVDAGAVAVDDVNASMLRIEARVNELDSVVAALSGRIRNVASSTQVIDELARRTSMLAVNAAVESARVGDHGTGFRHVAQEISDLAARARDATARIGNIVGELDAEVAATANAGAEAHIALEEGALLQTGVVEALRRIFAMVDHTTMATREITEATRQQRVAADAVVDAMTTVLRAGEQYRIGGQEHAGAAGRMRDLAGLLRETLDRFTIGGGRRSAQG